MKAIKNNNPCNHRNLPCLLLAKCCGRTRNSAWWLSPAHSLQLLLTSAFSEKHTRAVVNMVALPAEQTDMGVSVYGPQHSEA